MRRAEGGLVEGWVSKRRVLRLLFVERTTQSAAWRMQVFLPSGMHPASKRQGGPHLSYRDLHIRACRSSSIQAEPAEPSKRVFPPLRVGTRSVAKFALRIEINSPGTAFAHGD